MDSTKCDSREINKYLTWIHCNSCFELLIEKKQKLFLLNCQHVLCKSCLNKASIQNQKVCPKCKKPVNHISIDNSMPDHLKKFFKPDAFKCLSNLFDVIPFQIKHRDHFLKICDTLSAIHHNLEEKLKKKKEYIRRLDEQRKKMATARLHYEETIQSYRRTKARLSPEEVVRRRFASSFRSSHSSGSGGDKTNNFSNFKPNENGKNSPFYNLNHKFQSQNDKKNYHFHFDEQHQRKNFDDGRKNCGKSKSQQQFLPF